MERQQFILFIEPSRSDMPLAPTEEEVRLVGQHFEYLQRALADSTLVLAGRTQTPPFLGIAIFEAEDLDAAIRFANQDPAIKSGVFNLVRVQPYHVALIQA